MINKIQEERGKILKSKKNIRCVKDAKDALSTFKKCVKDNCWLAADNPLGDYYGFIHRRNGFLIMIPRELLEQNNKEELDEYLRLRFM